METKLEQDRLDEACRVVRGRVGRIRMLRHIHATAWYAAAGALALVLLLRLGFGWQGGEWLAVATWLGLWILLGAIQVRWKRPEQLESLLLLDRAGGWKDRYSSAWEFLHREDPSVEEIDHVRSASETITASAARFPRSAPLPRLGIAPWVVAATIAFALLPVARIDPDAADQVLTPEMRAAAARQADMLAEEADRIDGLEALSEEEREDLEGLRVEVEEVAETLSESGELTTGEMLEELEARARAAERLARQLDPDENVWASREMLEEMARHSDTVDLSLTIRDKAAAAAAEEAMKLHDRLADRAVRDETVGRLASVVEKISTAATDEDETRPTGERFGNASRKLGDRQPRTAAREFEELARHFRELEARERSRERLQKLAETLRESGGEVSGSQIEKSREMAKSGAGKGMARQDGLEALQDGATPEELQEFLQARMPQAGGNPSGGDEGSMASAPAPGEVSRTGEGREVPVPGSSPGESSTSGEQDGDALSLRAPIPGEEPSGGGGEGSGASDQARDGEGQGGMLSAPIPGSEGSSDGEGGAGVSLAAAPGSGSSQGGNQAGAGAAAMRESEDGERTEASRDSEVQAQIDEAGDSTVRAVEGQVRSERARRERGSLEIDFLAAEEQALDEQALPLSRKRHVLRYFSTLRREFEESNGEP